MSKYWDAMLKADAPPYDELVEKYEKFLMHLYTTTPHEWLKKEIEELLDL